MDHEDAGAVPTGDAPSTSEWSTSLLHTKVWLVLKIQYYIALCATTYTHGRGYITRSSHFPVWWIWKSILSTLRWRHNDHAGVSNHQPHGCLLNRLFGRKSKKTSKLRVTGLCAGNSPGTGEFPAQMASYAENVSIWWRHHEIYSQSTQWVNER